MFDRPLLKSQFDFELPASLIAQRPLAERNAARLLVLAATECSHQHIGALPELLRPEDLLVVNDTKVVPARLLGHKDSGGAAEFLLEQVLDEHRALGQVKVSKALRAGGRLQFGGYEAEVLGRQDRFYELRFSGPVMQVLDELGSTPLPPYIERAADAADLEDYQTPFATHEGAVAAPTAGLHFTPQLLQQLDALGVQRRTITLHVGAGTFTPMRAERVDEHRMHAERLDVPDTIWEDIAATHARGGRVVAVGTTVVRALESAARNPSAQATELFITPGFEFQVVDALLTNFHLPQSTLLMLVCAFAGTERTLAAYREAVAEQYRFFSYGDAMFIEARPA